MLVDIHDSILCWPQGKNFDHDTSVLISPFVPLRGVITNTMLPIDYSRNSKGPSDDRIDIVELLEAIAYLICQDDPITPNTFHKIFSNRGVPASIFRLADTNHDGAVSVDEMINFIMHISKPR